MISSTAIPCSSARSRRSCRIWAWTRVSRAVVGSSATTRRGLRTIPRPIMTRWRMPPESSWGYCSARCGGMPIAASTSRHIRRASSLGVPGRCARTTSTKWSTTRIRGSMGSWKISDTSSPRRRRSSSAPSAATSVPPTSSAPSLPAPSGRRPRIARPSVDLPQPDSPTRPRHSPGPTVRSTPSTATRGLRGVWYQTRRCRASSAGAAGAGLTGCLPRPRSRREGRCRPSATRRAGAAGGSRSR